VQNHLSLLTFAIGIATSCAALLAFRSLRKRFSRGVAFSAAAGLALIAIVAGFLYWFQTVKPTILGPRQKVTAAFSVTDAVAYSPATTPYLKRISTSTSAPSGPVVKVSPGMSTGALQSAISAAPPGATVLFNPGTYNVNGPLLIPCTRDLTITGPEVTPATAILVSSSSSVTIFNLLNCSGVRIQYLHFENTGIWVNNGDNSGITISHNQFTNLQAAQGVFFAGYLASSVVGGQLQNTLSDVTINYNTFGDPGSCTAEFASYADKGGYCAGVLVGVGEARNITIAYNNFIHVEQAVHFIQLLTDWKLGITNSVCVSCKVVYNYVVNYHRIAVEVQTSSPTDAFVFAHNAIVDPIHSFYGTFATSFACCGSSFLTGENGPAPGLIFDDNLLIATQPSDGGCPPYGVEFWGYGSQGLNSLIEGTFCNGYVWGFGKAPWTIQHNYICGPNYTTKGGYIADQQRQGNPPIQSGNVTSPNCSEIASHAPTISPAGGSFAGSQVVTLADPGLNTGIWYTTDGSTPAPGSGTAKYYTAPFTITSSTVVKAVGMWGEPNQPVRYPAGYGYVPSNVISASFLGTTSGKRSNAESGAQRGRAEAQTQIAHS
jgi:Chitobiase/beta-hexosaminidase C-terminal domain